MKLAILSVAVLSAAIICSAAPASAQPDGVQLAQARYEIWTDPRGRTFLIDPYTDEIVREVFREDRVTPRQRRRKDRRERRRSRLERELGRLFDLDRDEEILEDYAIRRRNRGRYFDDYADDPTPRRNEPARRMPLAEPNDDDIVRLPDKSDPAPRRKTLGGFTKPNYSPDRVAALQVVLDRAGFSPGVIDGKWGSNVANAMAAWKEARGENRLGNPDALEQELANTGGGAFFDYTLTQADVVGPFAASVPVDYAKKAQLERLAYTSVQEKIAEKFHMSEGYLRELNAGKNFGKSGTRLRVAAPGTMVRSKVHYIIADKSREQVRAYDRNGRLVTAYPATIGSAATPSPTGTHAVERIALNPNYTYDPKKNFQQGENNKVLTIPPGPNGPVGSVWIALSKPTYGIHGTPNPEAIGKTNSHGCIPASPIGTHRNLPSW